MNDIFLTEININSIRHLRDIKIPLSETERKHLILTGKNGSGKTSVLEVLRDYLESFYEKREFNGLRIPKDNSYELKLKKKFNKIIRERNRINRVVENNDEYQAFFSNTMYPILKKKELLRTELSENFNIGNITITEAFNAQIEFDETWQKTITEAKRKLSKELQSLLKDKEQIDEKHQTYLEIMNYIDSIEKFYNKILVPFNRSPDEVIKYGIFILTYFPAKRQNAFTVPKGITKIEEKEKYFLEEQANKDFIQFLVNMKADRSFARDEENTEIIEKIDAWFASFTDLLQEVFEDKNIKLKFDYRNYNFKIIQNDRNEIDFTTLSDGYASIFNIVTELMMRMEYLNAKIYDVQGIVLIDEIETHLHIDLQKKIMPFLTKIFPNIQFIVTTHSPFVLSSQANAVVFDLEKKILVEDMSGFSLDSVVEGYFDSDKYSQILKNKIAEYELLYNKKEISEEEEDRLVELKLYFKDLPTFLSPELAIKLNQIKHSKISARK